MTELFPLESSWIVALVSAVVVIVLLLEMSAALPAQNILLIAAVLLAAEAGLQYFMLKQGWIEMDGPLWAFLAGGALLWMAVILVFRRLGRLILKPWRKAPLYGIWLLALSVMGVAAFQYGWPRLNPEPVEKRVADFMTGLRAVSTLLLLLLLTPWLIRKRPRHREENLKPAQDPKEKTNQETQ